MPSPNVPKPSRVQVEKEDGLDTSDSYTEDRPIIEKIPLRDPDQSKPLTARSRRTESSRNSSRLDENSEVTERLYIFGAKLDNFRTIGPWHRVDGRYMNKLVKRLAEPALRPCSRGHSVGARYSEDNEYYDYAMSRPDTGYSSNSSERLRRSGARSILSSAAPRRSTRSTQDYGYDSWDTTPADSEIVDLDQLNDRMTRPTVSSRGGVDIAEKYENKDYVYGSMQVDSKEMNNIVSRITRPTVASTGGAGVQRKYTDFVYGDKQVSKDEFSGIINRLTKPTVASEGGKPLEKKPFIYKIPPITKTNPKIPNFEKKQQRLRKTKKVTAEELQDIVERLNKLTPAYKAKYSKNPHVWKDDAIYGPAFDKQVAAA